MSRIAFPIFFVLAIFVRSSSVSAMQARTILLDDKKVARILVATGRSTILNFPLRPTKVVLGNNGAFKVEYIENDLAISVRSSGLRSNMFVYLQGRRFAFDLVGTSAPSDEIVLIRDLVEVDEPKKRKK